MHQFQFLELRSKATQAECSKRMCPLDSIGTCASHRRFDDSAIRQSGWRRAKGAAGSERNKARAARDSELPSSSSIQNSSVYPRVFSIPNRVAWMIGILNTARHRIRAGLAGLGGPSSSSGVGGSESQSSLLLSTLVCGSKCSTVCYFCILFSLSSPQKPMIKRFLQSIRSKVCDKSI